MRLSWHYSGLKMTKSVLYNFCRFFFPEHFVIFGSIWCHNSLTSRYLGPLLLKNCRVWKKKGFRNFSDSILSFLENSDGRYVFKHFVRETNLDKKHSVSYGNGNLRAHLKKRKSFFFLALSFREQTKISKIMQYMGITLLSRNSLKVCCLALKMSFLQMSGLFNIGLKRSYKDLCYHIYETICTKRPSIKDIRTFFNFLTTPYSACRLFFFFTFILWQILRKLNWRRRLWTTPSPQVIDLNLEMGEEREGGVK